MITSHTLRDVVTETLSQRPAALLDMKPVEEIVVAGANLTAEGFFDRRGSSYDVLYIPLIMQTLAESGIPTAPRVNVTNYNLKFRHDIFDRAERADLLIVGNIPKTNSDAPPKDAPAPAPEDHWLARSPKSYEEDAWSKLADRLGPGIIATYGYGNTVDRYSFIAAQRGLSAPQPGMNNLDQALARPETGNYFSITPLRDTFDLLVSRDFVAEAAAPYLGSRELPPLASTNMLNQLIRSYVIKLKAAPQSPYRPNGTPDDNPAPDLSRR